MEHLFRQTQYTVAKLIEDIDLGEIGLPDLQRPFVWRNNKVRDLFDSLYRGYPIGSLLFWENGYPKEHRLIGREDQQKIPRLLIIDGQQRLTSLYAVMKGRPVLWKDYRYKKIRIGFHPFLEKFEVTNSAIEKDPHWLADISLIWTQDLYDLIEQYLERLHHHEPLSRENEKRIHQVFHRLFDLQKYQIPTVEISASVDEEQVAEIFKRVNSQGTPLNLSDFILTLMSVFWEEGRQALEHFSRAAKTPPSTPQPSPYNPVFQPGPDHLLRVSVMVGFRRAKLPDVYALLRGKDLKTRTFSVEQRDRQFALLQQAQSKTLNLQHWHDYLKVLKRAGYLRGDMISSKMAVLFTYALWLIGKVDYHIDPYTLREAMARWLFMALLTGRYTKSPESRMEQDLSLLRDTSSAQGFLETLEQEIQAVLTPDFWEVSLPNQLATASARNPGQFAFYASLCILDAPVLYSRMKVAELLSPDLRSHRRSLERHHLFPRQYLKRIGITQDRWINQVANYTLVEWTDNQRIGDRAPQAYVPQMEQRFTPEELQHMYRLHALPHRWYEMDYHEFLQERRKRMAQVIRWGFEHLGTGRSALGFPGSSED